MFPVDEDVRNEVKQGITQRDSFSVHFIVSIGALLSLSLSIKGYASFLLFLAPLAADFYAAQIFYSYSIHEGLSDYLSEVIEPRIAKLIEANGMQKQFYLWKSNTHFNSRFCSQKVLGIRKPFFKMSIFAVPVTSSFAFILLHINDGLFYTDFASNNWIVHGISF